MISIPIPGIFTNNIPGIGIGTIPILKLIPIPIQILVSIPIPGISGTLFQTFFLFAGLSLQL